MNLPNKFTFFNSNRILKLTMIDGDYYCTLPEDEANTLYSALWSVRDVEHNIHTGKWKFVADLTVDEKEPELKLPITVRIIIAGEWVSYLIEQDEYDYEKVVMTSKFGTGDNWKSFVKCAIKDGRWIVQSVGEQALQEKVYEPSPEEIVEPVQDFKVLDGAISAEKITVGNLSKLTINITSEGIDETTAKLERLAQAAENVTMAFESLQSVLDDMGLSFGNSTLTYEVHNGPLEDLFEVRDGGKPFCCSDI